MRASVIYRPEHLPYAEKCIKDHRSGWSEIKYQHEYLIKDKWMQHEEAMEALGIPVTKEGLDRQRPKPIEIEKVDYKEIVRKFFETEEGRVAADIIRTSPSI